VHKLVHRQCQRIVNGIMKAACSAQFSTAIFHGRRR